MMKVLAALKVVSGVAKSHKGVTLIIVLAAAVAIAYFA